MARARQSAEWARAGVVAAAARSAFGGEFDPLKFIPPAYRPPPAPPPVKTQEEIESESRRAWAVLDTVFGRRAGLERVSP